MRLGIFTALFCLGLTGSGLAFAESAPMKIGDVEYYGGSYDCENGVKIDIQGVELSAIPRAMFQGVLTSAEGQRAPLTLQGEQIDEQTVGLGLGHGENAFVVKSDFNIEMRGDPRAMLFGGNPDKGTSVKCNQVKFRPESVHRRW